ncbi:MAG: hypothetical protein KKI09_15580 [Spirochaetes bacterium]|nr:hypothetical protein [Spirochaetota bacterium]MBU0956842.1 hypothetical protein [Spirochaetota bacterium]
MKKIFVVLVKLVFVIMHIILWLGFFLPPLAGDPGAAFWVNPYTYVFMVVMTMATVAKLLLVRKLTLSGGQFPQIAQQILFWFFLRVAVVGFWAVWVASKATETPADNPGGLLFIVSVFLLWGYFVFLVQARKLRRNAQKAMINAVTVSAEGIGNTISENNALWKLITQASQKIKNSSIHVCVEINGGTHAVALQSVSSSYNYKTERGVATDPAKNFEQARTDWFFIFAGQSDNPGYQKETMVLIKNPDQVEVALEKKRLWADFCRTEKIDSLQLGKGYYLAVWKAKFSIVSLGYIAPAPAKLRELAEKFHIIFS